MNDIELAVYGRRNALGFCNILSVNWQGDMPDRGSLGSPYLDGRVADVSISDTHQTYCLVVDKIYNKRDPRSHVLQFCLRLPRNHELVGADGHPVSPLALLRQVAEKYFADYLKQVQDTYRYDKTDDAPTDIPVQAFREILVPYSTRRVWGTHTVMTGTEVAYINADTAAEADALMLALPWMSRLGAVQRVEVGRFSSDIPLMALSDAERSHSSAVHAYIYDRTGGQKMVTLGDTPVDVDSTAFGYGKDVYEPVRVLLLRDNILSAFYAGDSFDDFKDGDLELLPGESAVVVRFTPRKLTKTFHIALDGAPKEAQAAVYDGLSYNSKPINAEHTVSFVGENISAFLDLSRQARTSAFSLQSDVYRIKWVDVVQDTITIQLEKIEKFKAREEAMSSPEPSPSAARRSLIKQGKSSSHGSSVWKTVARVALISLAALLLLAAAFIGGVAAAEYGSVHVADFWPFMPDTTVTNDK